ncbi:uncharacterized protein BO80DRAFT_426734 [Aspergillus ibericus CBS 121593]|uniref:Secreted protein n=1 Tax=Aspergillus ibericus CBS 121593 TaxID=1448316 RepID=A0A395GUF1_9EURO|nr:hypothetical protein BO80DRAFT_426734 [Aspergillus ibericus CBS 121593]RAK99201.1 hypothetical protein BO80DRAFT_426734 [Aspergillus ibericus CBS 121593]
MGNFLWFLTILSGIMGFARHSASNWDDGGRPQATREVETPTKHHPIVVAKRDTCPGILARRHIPVVRKASFSIASLPSTPAEAT